MFYKYKYLSIVVALLLLYDVTNPLSFENIRVSLKSF